MGILAIVDGFGGETTRALFVGNGSDGVLAEAGAEVEAETEVEVEAE